MKQLVKQPEKGWRPSMGSAMHAGSPLDSQEHTARRSGSGITSDKRRNYWYEGVEAHGPNIKKQGSRWRSLLG
jgi:hypothetical protein